jgi:hypothetical protein
MANERLGYYTPPKGVPVIAGPGVAAWSSTTACLVLRCRVPQAQNLPRYRQKDHWTP